MWPRPNAGYCAKAGGGGLADWLQPLQITVFPCMFFKNSTKIPKYKVNTKTLLDFK